MFVSLALLVATAVSHAQVDSGRTVAVVNGVEIKGDEYYRRMEYLPGIGKMMGNSFAQFPPGFLTLEQLITEKLIFQLAKEKGCYPTEQEVSDEIKFALQVDPKTLDDWKDSGQTEAEFNYLTRFNLCQFKLATRGVNVTDAEVDKFYKDNIVMFTIAKVLSLRVIAVQNEEQARLVDADLAAGKKFADIAKVRSLDMSAPQGGDFGKRSWADLSEPARRALDNVKVGGTTAWIMGSNTRVKFMLEAVEPEVVKPLDAMLKRKIRRELMLAKGNVKNSNNLGKEMLEMRKKANVDIKQREFADAYKKFIDTFLSGKAGG